MKLNNPERHESHTGRIVQAMYDALKSEFSHLRKKSATDNPLPIIELQQAGFVKLHKHLDYFTGHEFDGADLRRNSQDILAKFFLHYSHAFTHSLQQQAQQFPNKPSWLRKKMGRDYSAWLHREEEMFSRVLTLSKAKEQQVASLAKRFEREEWYERLERGTLAAAVGSEIILLGPLELLSVPIWGIYAGERIFERLNDDFAKFRKHRLTGKVHA